MNEWTKVLDCCPGLLCCVINAKGKLLYASHGYKAIVSRLFGHKCKEGGNYPPMITPIDKTIHEVLMMACLGKTNAAEFTVRDKIWELTASPLRLDSNKIDGVVVRINSETKNNSPVNNNLPPVIQSNPEILDSVPFKACVVNVDGAVVAVNKFMKACAKIDMVGKNIIEFVEHDTNSGLLEIIKNRSGSIECKIHDIDLSENFYDFSSEIYLDEAFNEPSFTDKIITTTVKLHSTPIKWNGKDCTMITFEDITELKNTHEQLRRILIFDNYSGILNRRGMEHAILQSLPTAIKLAEHLSLIMINIDNFAALNEVRGYSNANRILRGFVNIMKRFLSDHGENIIAHWGGDEFMILLRCSGAAAVVMANEIRERTTTLEISAGIADLSIGGYAGMNDFIAAAYDAMIEAKALGGKQTILAK